ncbi:molybdopterin-dependent oxidoreductase [Acidovorax lacteus]|uniref:Nitrate reductase n=1 Tax=Acidovorax lacteus TaxID=1924988 RepID=A0ABP8LF88_9BURK
MATTRSTCPYCGVGCGVLIDTDGAHITGVRGDPEHPANHGRLCTKGSTLHLTATPAVLQQARLLQPRWRAGRQGPGTPLAWDAALDQAATRLADIAQAHGPDALGFYVSGQLLTEDYYVFNKLAKGLLGTNNIDTNSRLCMSSAVAGYKATLGADAPPACYEDVDHADCLFIAGSNTAWAHPVLYRRIEQARAARPGQRMVVVDPRRTDTAEQADLHLAIQPGTDVMLFNGMLHLMLWEGWTDNAYIAAHTTGFDALKARVRDCTPAEVARVCGIAEADLLTATRWFAGRDADGQPTGGRTLSLYCQGLNQSSSGTDKNAALINLHLATGQIGRPGAGPFSLTGQPNAMGGREVGGLANLLSAHRDLANPDHRAEVAAFWGVPSVPATPGKTAVELFEAAADGAVRALWIACTNPAQSMPDQATVRRALERAEFVVVQEAFGTTATARYADLLLPATTWAEKTGTVTNSERRISRVRPALPAPGEARHDWVIATQLAQRLEARLRPGLPTLFPYDTANADAGAEAIWNEHRETTRGRDLDITGLSWATLDRHGPQQWPCPEPTSPAPAGQPVVGAARLYTDGVFPTSDGRARFAAVAWRPVAEPRSARYPFSLTTGRLRDQWHGMSRTGTLGRLFAHVPEPCVQVHPQDLERRRLHDGQLVQVRSARGSVVLPVQASTSVAPTQAFIAMHWGSEYLGGRSADGQPLAGVNALTPPAFCPGSKQPELKHTAVRIDPVDLPWGLWAMAWLPEAEVLRVREALAAHLADWAYAVCVPFASDTPLAEAGQARHGVLLRAADASAPPAAQLAAIEGLLGLRHAQALRYTDPAAGHHRALRLQAAPGALPTADAALDAFVLAGDTQAGPWLRGLLLSQAPAAPFGRHLLQARSAPPEGAAPPPRAAAVCSCLNVGADAITACLARSPGNDAERLAQLQQQLRCGTQCGSCVPELKRLVRSTAPAGAVSAALSL